MLFAEFTAGMPEAASTLAHKIDDLYVFLFWVSIISMIGVTGAILYFGIKYRRTEDNQEATSKVDHNLELEVVWTAVPTFILFLLFFWGMNTWMEGRISPSESMDIHVEAKQWAWTFEYPKDGITSDHLIVPVDKPIRLIMGSTDVLHSFFVPEFRVKQDVVPGQYTTVWFEVPSSSLKMQCPHGSQEMSVNDKLVCLKECPPGTKTDQEGAGLNCISNADPSEIKRREKMERVRQGTFNIMCTEYCGKDHSRMNRKVVVMTNENYTEWIDSGGGLADLSLVDMGELLFQRSGCTQCHSVDGSAGTGPSLKGLYGKDEYFTDGSSALADENYIRESILYPNRKIVKGYTPAMPSYANSLRDKQLTAIVEYVKSIGAKKEDADE